MFVFIRSCARVELNIGTRSVFSKVGQFGKVSATDYQQVKLGNGNQTVYFLPLYILPVNCFRSQIDPINVVIIGENKLAIDEFHGVELFDFLFFNLLKLDSRLTSKVLILQVEE